MAIASAAALWRGAWSQQHCHATGDLSGLNRSSKAINIVHIKRPGLLPCQSLPAQQLMSKPGLQAVIDVCCPEAAIEYLLHAVQQPELQEQVHADLQQAAQQISAVMQRDHVRAKLEVVQRQSCPNWHADTVGIRMLCSYAGPGTWYIENRHVQRHVNWMTGDTAIQVVDEQHAVQAGLGDLLYLKGNAFPGMQGAGAVHKSPAITTDSDVRLLLTVDDACC